MIWSPYYGQYYQIIFWIEPISIYDRLKNKHLQKRLKIVFWKLSSSGWKLSGKNQKACCETDDRKYLYFKFDKDQNSPVALPKPAQSGRWYISTGWYISADRFVIFDDDEAIVTESIEYGFTSCPNDALVMKTFSKNGNKIAVDLECNPRPTANSWERLGKVLGKGWNLWSCTRPDHLFQ